MNRQESVREALHRMVAALTGARPLDPLAQVAFGPARALVARRPDVADLLRGRWLGHSLHPLLTDFAEGAWMAASFLDLFGPRGSDAAARRLLGFGLAVAVPTYASGMADAASARGEARRLALAHAVSSTTAFALYAASYAARRRRERLRGAVLGLAGGVVALADGYVAGHLGHVAVAGVEDRAASRPDDRLGGGSSG